MNGDEPMDTGADSGNEPEEPTPAMPDTVFSKITKTVITSSTKRSSTIQHANGSPTRSPKSKRSNDQSPTSNLLRSTESRKADLAQLNKKRMEVAAAAEPPTPEKSPKKSSYAPSERLLKTTQARIIDTKELQQRKERINHDDDIWWEQRGKHFEIPNKNKDVSSKLMEPTVAYLKSQREKAPQKKLDKTKPEVIEKEPAPVVAKIDSESPLLKPTRNSISGAWGVTQETPTTAPLQTYLIESQSSGPQNVASKLYHETSATAHAKWKTKEQIAAEEAEKSITIHSGGPRVKEPSERLLSFNTNMKAHARTKLQKPEPDPREIAWTNHYIHENIPLVEELPPPRKSSPTRRHSTASDSGANHNHSGSLSTDGEGTHKNGKQASQDTSAVENHLEGLHVEETTTTAMEADEL